MINIYCIKCKKKIGTADKNILTYCPICYLDFLDIKIKLEK